jgi:hypothetical protein
MLLHLVSALWRKKRKSSMPLGLKLSIIDGQETGIEAFSFLSGLKKVKHYGKK